MNLTEWLGAGAACVAILAGGSKGADWYLHDVYLEELKDTFVTVSSQNLKLLYDMKDELNKLENISNPTLEQVRRMATLRERIRNLETQ